MNRRSIFLGLRATYFAIDRALFPIFGLRFRQKFLRFSYLIKIFFFPEYGSHVPDSKVLISPTGLIQTPPVIPDWVLEEMRQLGKAIDPALYPTDRFLSGCQYYYYPVNAKPGQLYSQLLQRCTSRHYTHCFAIPWLKRGGADLLALRHVFFATSLPGAKVLLLLTEPGDSSWLSRVPDGVDVVDISQSVGEISHKELLLIIARLLVQLNIDVLHIINSRHAWEVVGSFGLAIRQHTRIFASVYCDDHDKNGLPIGFAREYLGCCYRHLTKVFSDNEAFPRLLRDTYGYAPDLFQVLRIPVPVTHHSRAGCAINGRRVLWAGRLDRQKRPDLLLKIARSLPDVDFSVYGDAVLEYQRDVVETLRRLPNVKMMGPFDGAESLPFDEYSIFLYTSQWDGTPTIVIAAASASIPIVASCVGGVAEIVTENTGFPVTDIEDVGAYVRAIVAALGDSTMAESRAAAAQRHVALTHSDAVFNQVLFDTPGYVNLADPVCDVLQVG